MPQEGRVEELERDYREMREMLFGDIPSFKEILHCIAELEVLLNGVA